VTAYFNEIDPYAAQWLRNLIAAGHIADGVVDERSIEDVLPSDLRGFTQCHFFAGIGVWSHALRLAGWPDDRPVWTGSCPCQPFSAAGKGLGVADERHLWPAWAHLIRECRPVQIRGEQVASRDALAWWDVVCADLEDADYACGAFDLCAAGVGAPHIRQRLFWLADDHGAGRSKLGRGRVLHGERAPQRDDADRCGADGLMADSHGRHAGAERQQRRGEHRLQPARRRSVLLGDAGDEGLAQRIGFHGVPGGASGADAGEAAFGAGFHAGELAHAGQVKRGRWPHEPQPGCADSRERDEAAIHDQRRSGARFWDACDWIECRDGKRRPVEPGTFPLAHGAPARVGRLRAYGNAIVAPLAAEFVRATL
jgi:DNA (cytosine-5)-methyltransferase 1